MLVCALALVTGAVMALLLIPSFNTIMHTQLTFFSKESILPFIIVYTITVVLSGLLPSIQIIRQNALIAFHGAWQSGQSSVRLRNSLVFLQLMVSFVMLAVALLIVRQTDYLLKRDTGFNTNQIVAVNATGLPPNERITLKLKLMQQLSVSNVAMCSTPPGQSLFTFGLRLPGTTEDEERRITFFHLFVDENFLQTMGIDLEEGRFFNAEVPADSVNAFVVNATGAATIRDSVMTREIEIPNIYTGNRSKKTIVGVISDFHFASFHTAVQPLLLEYSPKYAQYLLVRFASANAQAAIDNLGQIWKEHAPLLPLNYYFLNESFAKSYAAEQRTRQIVMIISWLSLFLAALGIFGTSLFVLQQRTKEIGVRKLLGSATYGLFVLVFRPMFLIFFAASVVGIPIAVWLGNEWLAAYPYHAALSIEILLTSFTTILIVILLTVSFYLFKIIGVQPAKVLRNQ
jgi:putative ABC transport system permease protein